MVRLKERILEESNTGFHSFNSTMVRLKGRAVIGKRKRMSCFNSTMVRLKAFFVVTEPSSLVCFNSTMVRLKDIIKTEESVTPSFQFHYGTIKSEQSSESGNECFVSIPLWYD